MTNQNNAAQAAPQQTVLTREQIGELYKDWVCVFGVSTGSAELCIREIEAAVLSQLRAPVADEREEISGVTLDGCLETLFRVGEHLGINYAESRKQPGAPSGVYIKAIEDRISRASNAAREEAAKLMDQTSRSSGAALIRALASAPAHGDAIDISRERVDETANDRHEVGAPVAGEAVAHAVLAYGRIQRVVVNEECAHEYAEQQRLNAEAAGWDAKAHVRPLVYGDAAPQASAEYERGHADGWAAGWDQAIKQPQADKDGGGDA
ncbi:hypothetical protein [Achromobacter xylosoxidans]|uniref:hypothetical protein n=2 Tax=Achromobacter TaxID=222 RepID=UPI0006C86B7A|nr:hypothetical protein [Achromobacter xylosoxidans]QQE57425.1 hypothetical protein I6H41_31925 [Achromobacter xylosoxidans]QQV17064.1 hypothetical protein I6I48_14865 [Achromobacter xylosoxidans]